MNSRLGMTQCFYPLCMDHRLDSGAFLFAVRSRGKMHLEVMLAVARLRSGTQSDRIHLATPQASRVSPTPAPRRAVPSIRTQPPAFHRARSFFTHLFSLSDI